MNMGRAVNIHDDEADHAVVAIEMPAGLPAKISMATAATAINVGAIHTPMANIKNISPSRTETVIIGSNLQSPVQCAWKLGWMRYLPVSNKVRKLSAMATANNAAPIAIDNCGIHSGVASRSVLTSFNRHVVSSMLQA